VQETGFIFPEAEREPEHFHSYVVRRKLTLTTIFGAGGIFVLKLIFVGLVSAYLLGAQPLLAAMQNWDMSVPSEYTYDNTKIEFTNKTAQLKDQLTGGSCGGTATACTALVTNPTCGAQAGCSWGSTLISGATTNPDFTSDNAGWAYADWENNGKVAGTHVATGGNPTGYVDITVQAQRNKTTSGYWTQSFVTTADSPTTTLGFDWKITGYDGSGTSAFNVYAVIDSATGAPNLSNAVWSQTITGATAWASASSIDVSSKIGVSGTYYLKLVARRITGNGPIGDDIVGFDNVQLNWSGTASTCSGTATACTALSTSPTCSAQGGCSWALVPNYPSDEPSIYPNTSLNPTGVTSWNSFTETATKNGGSINYQISDDDGVSWQYWNGSAWTVASNDANSNSASVINTNIITFPTTAGKIKWKAFLVSNGSQLVVLDNIAVGYTQNDPPSVFSLAASQDTNSGYVYVNYRLRDADSDPEHLVNYEYSLTGAFGGEQIPMTPATTDPAHSGITGLTSSPSGVAHTFVWNALMDLGNTYNATVYVRLRANDNITDGDYATSSVFAVDYLWPYISNVSATQMPSSSDIQINYDVFDNTADNILVELQVSSDGGSTWTVPAVTLSGDVGPSVTSGNGKSMIWHAGTDFSSQEQSNMMAQVRPKDKYQNQGDYAGSNTFILDNRAPVVATPTDLLAQPLAGATTALVGGSFSEGNPDTNDFYIALNGGAYGTATAGDANTATPSDKSVPTGIALKGNDYISSVKIEHTDDFGWATNNENTSPNSVYKYVKPYTPPAPTISAPGADSLSVTINKHSSEADGLEYVILESTGGLYVQSDGSLGSSPYWQVVGTVTVTGLSQPISQYSFQTKSRNISDTSFAPSSESDFSSGASSDYQSPQITINSNAQTTDGTKYVVIHYTGTDSQNSANNLTKYEYSLNNTDWLPMTEKAGVGSDGITGLAFTSGGTSLTFAWDVGTDLPSVEDSAVYIRLESNDAITNSNTATSAAFVVNTAGPVISNIQAIQTQNTNNIIITYDLIEGAGTGNVVTLSISSDSGATYAVPIVGVSGDVGSNVTAGLEKNIVWDAGINFNDQEKTTMKVKLVATDSYGNEGLPVESIDFSTDTKAPVVSDVSANQTPGSALVVVNYNLADLSSNNIEFEVSSDSGFSWSVTADTYTGNMGSEQTPGAKTFNWNAVVDFPDQESATMRIRIRALDAFGNQGIYSQSADFSINTKILSISNISATQAVGGTNVIIHYDLNKNATINIDISSDGGVSWTVPKTTLTGSVGAGINSGNNRTVAWNAGTDFPNQENSSMRVRINGIDELDITSPYYESSDFSVDTASPLGLSALNKFASTENSVTMSWPSSALDANFDHYELWHGATRADVINRAGTALEWGVLSDSALSSATTVSTVITGVSLTSDYFVKIWAIDVYGNESTITDINAFTATIPQTFDLTIQTSDGSGSVNPTVGSHSYSDGDHVNITATASTNWIFDHWILDNVSGGSANPLSVTMNEGHTLKAVFVEFTPPSPTEKTLTIGATTGGTTDPAPGYHNYDTGSAITVTATPDTGYQFVQWEEGGDLLSATNPINVVLNNNRSISAIFELIPSEPITPTPSYPTEIVSVTKPILTPIATPIAITDINISGLAQPQSKIDLYDNGVLIKQLDNPADANGRFGQTISFSAGIHNLTVRATDASGNTGEASDPINFEIITSNPETPIILSPRPGDNITEAQPVLIGVALPLSQLEITLDGKDKFTVSVDVNGAWRFSLPSDFALSDGQHTFTAKSIDLAGNVSPETTLNINKITPIVPITPPIETPGGIPAPAPGGLPNIPGGVPAPVAPVAPIITPTPPASIIREVNNAIELPGVPVPEIIAVNMVNIASVNDSFAFSGKALPNQDVVVYINSDQALVYRTRTDNEGIWKINHSQNLTELAPGQHTIFAVAVDPTAKVKSAPSSVSTFTVTKNFWVDMFNRLNLKTTIVTLAAVLLIMLWLYGIKRKEKTKARF
jgi:hypothetical protein